MTSATWEGGPFSIRPLLPSDAPYMYALATSPAAIVSWRHRGTTPPPDKVLSSLWSNAEVVMIGLAEGRPVGVIVLYEPDYRNQVASLAVLTDDQQVGSGVVFGPVRLFLNYVFDVFPFRKLYIESDGSTYLDRFGSSAATASLVQEEGRLKDYYLFSKATRDKVIVTLDRNTWCTSPISGFDEHTA